MTEAHDLFQYYCLWGGGGRGDEYMVNQALVDAFEGPFLQD